MKKENNLVKGSLILLVLANFFNLLNLLFQVFVAHKLSVESYGIFTSLFSVIYFFAIFSESIQLTTAKKVALSKSDNETKKISSLAIWGSFKISIIVFMVYSLVLFLTYRSIGVPFGLIFLNGCIILFSLTAAPVFRGVLQGQKRFLDLGLNLVSEGVGKLLFGLFFIFLGFQIYGALGAIVISMFISFIYGFLQTRKVFSLKLERNKKINLLQIFKPEVLFIMSCVMILFMLDVFIVTLVLSPVLAGYYAIAASIAKTAFVGTIPISKAMLSHVASEKDKLKQSKLFKKSLYLLISILTIGLILICFFSDLAVFLFSGANKEVSTTVLPIIFIAVSFISVANLVLCYKIALDKISKAYILLGFLLLSILALLLIPSTLISFAVTYLIITIIFLIASIVTLR